MPVSETTLDAPGRVRLHLRTTRPEGDARGIFILVHGLGEHGGRYDHVASALTAVGVVVCAFDNRGHGRSTGLRGHVDTFADYTSDLQLVIAEARSAHGEDLPLLVYGHSMGGLIVLSHQLEYPNAPVAGFAVSNPLIRTAFEPSRIKAAAGRLLSRVLPKLRLDNELDASGISRDPAEVKAYQEDPFVHSLVSTRWFTSMTSAALRVEQDAARLRTPSLWILSGADPVVDSKAGAAAARLAQGAEVKVYPDSVHEPHNDLDRELVIADLTAWVGSRLGPA
jgi:alpha-beta hydrolase superfamily lysophospholipase